MLVVLRRTPAGPTRGPSSVAPPDIFSQGAGNSRDQFAGQGSGENVRIELADRRDSSRVAMVILAKKIDPLEGRRYAVVEPSAYRFLEDGRVMHVRANSGKFTWPSRDQPPEQGTFEGDVRITLYAAGFRPGADATMAVVIGEAILDKQLDFDTTFGEASTPGMVHATLGSIGFVGEGVRILFDEVRNGVQLVRVERTWQMMGYPTIEPGAPATIVAQAPTGAQATPGVPAPASVPDTSPRVAVASPNSPSSSTPPNAPQVKATESIETLYRAVCPSPLTLTAGTKRIDASTGEGFVRLVNNALRPGAIADFSLKGEPKVAPVVPVDAPAEPQGIATVPPAEPQGGLEASPAPMVPAKEATKAKPEPDWMLESDGSLEIRPLGAPGAELVRNDVFVKLRGDGTPVVASDSAARATVRAPGVNYAATRGDLLLNPDAVGLAELRTATGGVAHFTQLGVNLPTRVGQTRGPGEFVTGEGETVKGASWSEQADFEFFPKTADWKLKYVNLAGTAKAWDGLASVVGDVLRAELDQAGQFTKAHVTGADGAALAIDGKGGKVGGDDIDVAFKPAEDGKSEPSVVTATGHALASRGSDVLSAGLIEATMGKGKDGKNSATNVLARDGVKFVGKDAVSAGADELRADVLSERVTLVGKDAFAAKGQTRVDGEVIKLGRTTERIDVEGPGRFTHSGQSTEGGSGVVAAKSQWAQSMSFDNATGILEARGSTHSEIMPDKMTIDKIDGDFIRVELEPLAIKDPQSTVEGPAQGDRKVVKAVVKAAPERPELATVESRKYDAVVKLGKPGKAAVEQLVFLEGREILADLSLGTLDVPGKGRSVVLDRRASQVSAATPAPPTPGSPLGGSSRGTALFEWEGSMHYVRPTGDLSFLDGAKLTHAREADGTTMYLEAKRVDAVVQGTDKSGAPSESAVQRGRLVKATGTGAVFSKLKSATGERQLTSDRFLYDADLGSVRAWADESAEIIVYDSTTASPVRAAEILWDLAKDRVDVVKPSTIVAPR